MSDNASREPSPREKILRIKVLARRAPAFYRGALAVFFVVFTAGILSILRMPRVYESETVVLARDAIRTDPHDSSPRIQAQRLGPKIKDLLFARSRLEKIILELGLYQEEIESFGMLEAVEEMRTQIGFRTRDSDMFVISFQSTDRELSQRVTARLAESMIEEFVRDNVGRTQAARDFLAEEERRAEADLDEKGRALAEFLAQNPEFAWDPSRSFPGMPGLMPFVPAPSMQAAPPPVRLSSDPELASLQRERARLEEQLGARPRATVSPEVRALAEARDRAKAALAQAQAELADKRQKLTEEHPDVIAARNRAITAGRAFGEAEAAYEKVAASSRPAAPVANEARLREQLASVKAAIAARERVLQSKGSKGSSKKQPTKAPAPGWAAVELETEWQRLIREVSEARRLKDEIAARRARAELAASATASSGSMLMTIIDPAYLPTRPVKPKRMVLGMMTLALSAALGVLWTFARVILDDIVFDAPDVEGMGGPNVLVSVPRDPLVPEVQETALVAHGPRPVRSVTQTPPPANPPPAPPRLAPTGMGRPSSAALAKVPKVQARAKEEEEPQVIEFIEVEGPRSIDDMDLPVVGLRAIAALRVLRFRIEQRSPDGRMVVGVTSAVAGEGKSRLAIQLALALAESERARVLLVEANLERPSLAKLLGVELREEHAFSTQMRRRALEEVAVPWQIAACGGSLHLLAECPDVIGFPGMLHSRELRIAIGELRPLYDYIVVDGPSILDDGGATSVERVVDGFVIVARAKVTKKSSLGRAARMLGQERMLGVVLTDVEEEA